MDQQQPPSPQPQPVSAGPPAPQGKPTAPYADFAKLDLRVAKVLEVANHPNADKLYVLKIDLGTEQRQIIAGLRPYVPPEGLLGRNVIVVTNLEPRKMRGLDSNGMLLAASFSQDGQQRVVILTTDLPAPPGSPVS